MINHLQLEGMNIQHGPLFSHTFMALQAAVHGQGIVLANKILAQQEIDNGNLQVVLPSNLSIKNPFMWSIILIRATNERIVAFRGGSRTPLHRIKLMNKLALYCRAGFEKEVAVEMNEKATARDLWIRSRSRTIRLCNI